MRALFLWLVLVLPALAQTNLYINFSQSTVEGGATLEGIVASNVPAPAQGIMVLLTAGDGATVPDRVFIEPGQKATRFPIETRGVSRNRSVQVRAQVGSVVAVNLVHLTPVGEQIARNPPPSQALSGPQIQTLGPNYGYGYGMYGPGYGYDYGYGYGYGYGYNYGYGFPHPNPGPAQNPSYQPQNLPHNWPAGSTGIPADYPRFP